MTLKHRRWLNRMERSAYRALQDAGVSESVVRHEQYDAVRDVMLYAWVASGKHVTMRWDLHKNEPYTELIH